NDFAAPVRPYYCKTLRIPAMIPDRSRLRVISFALLAVFALVAATPLPVVAQAGASNAASDSVGDAIGKLFKDVLRGTTEPGVDSLTPPATTEPQRQLPASRTQVMQSFSPLVKATAPAVVN